ncbi:ribonucleoside-diphosphate reductase large subunit-like [Solenopsis invicta]|uniref:ribonucleoside-diphosphate reductase large subunit-like n=1 Tax=Solenopsis invicta TaxID=13686 RepID=UPI0005963539|nr:ribonucleoside-diphosphate reductase large subunit-like [Solenopsis invicta]
MKDRLLYIYADIFEFLDLKRSARSSFENICYRLWTPHFNEVFIMKRVCDDVSNLICPHECPVLIETWGDEFEALCTRYKKKDRFSKTS